MNLSLGHGHDRGARAGKRIVFAGHWRLVTGSEETPLNLPMVSRVAVLDRAAIGEREGHEPFPGRRRDLGRGMDIGPEHAGEAGAGPLVVEESAALRLGPHHAVEEHGAGGDDEAHPSHRHEQFDQ